MSDDRPLPYMMPGETREAFLARNPIPPPMTAKEKAHTKRLLADLRKNYLDPGTLDLFGDNHDG